MYLDGYYRRNGQKDIYMSTSGLTSQYDLSCVAIIKKLKNKIDADTQLNNNQLQAT